jgi:uncharacterized RDD family membrane protein YckC
LEFETPERVALSIEVAGLGTRSLAYLIDILLIFLFWTTALLIYSVMGDLLRRVQELSAAAQVLGVLLFFLSGWAYDLVWELRWNGQTPGKRALGIRVVSTDGAPVGLLESAIRNLSRAIEVPLLYAPGVLFVALTRRHQRLGDLLAGTVVIRDRGYDLSRYQTAPAEVTPLAARVAATLSPAEFERLADFVRRRAEIEPAARGRIAQKIATPLVSRAGVALPSGLEAEPFLEALVAGNTEGPGAGR